MSLLKIGGIIGTGGIGILAASMIVSDMLGNELKWIFGLVLILFVAAGGIALIAKSIR